MLSSPLLVADRIQVNTGLTADTNYNRMGTAFSSHGLASGNDLFVSGESEFDADIFADGQLLVAGGTFLHFLSVTGDLVTTGDLFVGDDINAGDNINAGGDINAGGTKSSLVITSSGERKLYALESPTVRFIDEGFSSLVDGTVRIDLEPIFMETIEGRLLIHVTPYGPTTLYVKEIGENYFVVESIDGSDVDFGWYVSAFRQGYSDIRLEETGR